MINQSVFDDTALKVPEGETSLAIKEAVIWDELMLANPTIEEMTQFLSSDEYKGLVEQGALHEGNSVVVLSRLDDLARRTKMAAIQFAKDKKDSLYEKWIRHKAAERAIEDQIEQKYKSVASREAKAAQKDYIKSIPNAFTRRVNVQPLKMK